MVYLARLLGLAAIAALIVPVLQKPGFSQELSLTLTSPLLAQADSNSERRAEGDRLLELGHQQYQASEFQAAIESWQQALEIYREIGDRRGEETLLNNVGLVYDSLGQYAEALDYYQRSLAIAQEIGDRRGEGTLLNNVGLVYDSRGQYAEALDYYQRSLAIAQEVGDRRGEGASLSNVGGIYYSLGQYAKALDYYQRSLAIRQEIGDRRGEGTLLNNVGSVYRSLGQYAEALDYHQRSLAIAQEIGDRGGEGTSLSNVGSVYYSLGQYAAALDDHQRSLAIAQEIGDRRGEGTLLNNVGSVYRSLGQYAEALDYYQRSLAIAQEIGDRSGEGTSLSNVGGIYYSLGQYAAALDYYQRSLAIAQEIGDRRGEGNSLNNVGSVYSKLGQYAEALDYYQRSLAIRQEIGDRSSQGVSLNNVGHVYDSLGQYAEALDYYQRSLAILQEIGDRGGEAIVLNNIGSTLEDQSQLELAIVFRKQSVNVYESIRGGLGTLDTDLQSSYTDSIANTYRRLADLLLQQDRILEAQRVLDLLKVQELDEYLRDVRGNSNTQTGVDYLRPEAAILARYEERQQSAIALGQELETLKDIAEDQRSTAQNQRIAQLTDLLAEINSSFGEFTRSPEIRALLEQLSYEAREASVNLDQLSRQRDELQQLNAAIFYPLILEDRLELVITTPDSPPLRRTVPVTKAELNEAILAFRQALTQPSSDIEASAQQLYDWLVRPLEDDLAAAGVETIIYAPDGQLRYIPLAALHDGNQWLTQRYQVNNITAASLTDLTKADAAQPRILAAAYTDETLVHTPEVNGTSYTFTGLPGAGLEVETLPAERTFLNQAFSLSAVRPIMDEYTVLHLATHAAFVPGVPEDSFILFGNGDTPTLRDIEGWTLNGVDLVVLSACETGVGGLGNGEEILGLGYTFQLQGARAVLSSLWQVSDQGTQVLMTAFYNALSQGMTKAEALQQAQTTLITGDFSATAAARAGIGIVNRQTEEAFTAEILEHPYYWAPFILIGNGL